MDRPAVAAQSAESNEETEGSAAVGGLHHLAEPVLPEGSRIREIALRYANGSGHILVRLRGEAGTFDPEWEFHGATRLTSLATPARGTNRFVLEHTVPFARARRFGGRRATYTQEGFLPAIAAAVESRLSVEVHESVNGRYRLVAAGPPERLVRWALSWLAIPPEPVSGELAVLSIDSDTGSAGLEAVWLPLIEARSSAAVAPLIEFFAGVVDGASVDRDADSRDEGAMTTLTRGTVQTAAAFIGVTRLGDERIYLFLDRDNRTLHRLPEDTVRAEFLIPARGGGTE